MHFSRYYTSRSEAGQCAARVQRWGYTAQGIRFWTKQVCAQGFSDAYAMRHAPICSTRGAHYRRTRILHTKSGHLESGRGALHMVRQWLWFGFNGRHQINIYLQPKWNFAVFGWVWLTGGRANKKGQLPFSPSRLAGRVAARQIADQTNAHCGSREETLNWCRAQVQLAAGYNDALQGQTTHEVGAYGDRWGGEQFPGTAHKAATAIIES